MADEVPFIRNNSFEDFRIMTENAASFRRLRYHSREIRMINDR